MRILKAYNNFYVAIIFLLIFISTLLAPLELHPKISYAIIFLLYVSVILFLKNSIVVPLLILIPFLLFILLIEGSYIFDVMLGGFKSWNF